jgi:DNA repair protein RecN (Recombination protein N)
LLVELRVRDFAIIEQAGWNPGPGFNVVTGETGAGKSLVVDAVEALLTGHMEEDSIRHGAQEAGIEGVFDASTCADQAALKRLLTDNGIGPGEPTLVISCSLRRQGRTITRVNGHAVPRTLAQNIGRLLVDIHGQSQHLSLLDAQAHLDFLDGYARTLDLRTRFSERIASLQSLDKEIAVLSAQAQDCSRHEELLRFQVDEIRRANLRDGEDEELDREKTLLTHAEKLKGYCQEVGAYLEGEEGGAVLDSLRAARQSLKRLAGVDPSLAKTAETLEGAFFNIEEVAREVAAYSERLESDPGRLADVESRLDLLRQLKRKYGSSAAAILEKMELLEQELEGVGHSTQKLEILQSQRSTLRKESGRLAQDLSAKRAKASRGLSQAVKEQLAELNMEGVDFAVAISRTVDPAGIPLPDGTIVSFGQDGIDCVEFQAATNPGEPLRPLARIASTGEISRFTLAIKTALADADRVPVLIFDEIDIGVGGRSGDVIGHKLWSLGRGHQVICVTHLPQIAAFSDVHFNVHKEASAERATSRLDILGGDKRLQELALMLSGAPVTETSLKNARELVQRAEGWKKERSRHQA